jgi:large subunit ribosomal protein L2
MTSVSYKKTLTGDKPWRPLLKRLKSHSGRNSQGRITVRHQGGGNKRLYRMINFKQLENPAKLKVETLEYDPYRTSFIARVIDKSNKRSYILAGSEMKVDDEIIVGDTAPLKTGNRLRLKNIPVGYQVFNVEIKPGKGGQMARSAGSYIEILAQSNGYTDLKLSSNEVRRVSWDCFASIGQVSNSEHNLVVIGKAGRSRWLGIRPTVRGSVMNPVDHPYGGGEGRTQRGTRKPKTLWGKVTGGHKTRNKKKWSNKLILKRRVKK